jgi:anti-sigma B factor antagonist
MTADNPTQVTLRSHGPIVVAELSSDLNRHTAGRLRDVLTAATGRYRHVVVDLTGVRTVDPEGLALLVRTRQQVRQDTDGQLCLAAPSRFVLTVLHTMRLERAFPLFADPDTAITWLTCAEPPLMGTRPQRPGERRHPASTKPA